jgi:hypothetical protein
VSCGNGIRVSPVAQMFQSLLHRLQSLSRPAWPRQCLEIRNGLLYAPNHIIWLCFLALAVVCASTAAGDQPAARAELRVTASYSLPLESEPIDGGTINALQIDTGSVIVSLTGSEGGAWLIGHDETSIVRLLAPESRGDWWSDCMPGTHSARVFMPSTLHWLGRSGSVGLFDSWCGQLLELDLRGSQLSHRRLVTGSERDGFLSSVTVNGSTIVAGVRANDPDMLLAVMDIHKPGTYRYAFGYGRELKPYMDSVGLYRAVCLPATYPADSTIWVAVQGYPWLFVINWSGDICDSLPVDGPGFTLPEPPPSRIKSAAVVERWAAGWTPIHAFRCTGQGVFILQYTLVKDEDRVPVRAEFGSVAWSAEGERLQIDIPRSWQLAGTQADRVCIFGYFEKKHDKWSIELKVTELQVDSSYVVTPQRMYSE